MTAPSAPSSTPAPATPTTQRTQSFHGTGLAILRSYRSAGGGGSSSGPGLIATFECLSFTFPLKLIHPRVSSINAGKWVSSRTKEANQQPPASSSSSSSSSPSSSSSSSAAAASGRGVAALYIVGYGGGLVSGDHVDLDVDVGEQCTLLLLTQGTTKVFKMRDHPSTTAQRNHSTDPAVTTCQKMRFLIRPQADLIVLPDAVTCYASARYLQVQQFDLMCPRTSSLVLLDWITPGRHKQADKGKVAEEWEFESYRSRNEVRIRGCGVVVRDVLELAQTPTDSDLPTLKDRTRPYKMYASLFLIGPKTADCVQALEKEWASIQQRPVVLMSGHGHGRGNASFRSAASGSSAAMRAKMNAEAEAAGLPTQQAGMVRSGGGSGDDDDNEGLGGMSLLWSFSQLQLPQPGILSADRAATTESVNGPIVGAVVRLAALESDAVKRWLSDRLVGLRNDVIGPDLYRQAFS